MSVTSDDLSLLAALTQCFEKDEVSGGWHLRTVPFRTEQAARDRFGVWHDQLLQWFGPPQGEDAGDTWQRAWWTELRMKRDRRGIQFWVRSADVGQWWFDRDLWQAPGLEGLWTWDGLPAT